MGWLLLGLALGCSGKAESESDVGATAGEPAEGDEAPSSGVANGPGSGVPDEAPPGLGWSSRDGTPFGRIYAQVLFDTLADRLLVVGDTATEIWSLALSGPDESRWRQLVPQGEVPPASLYDSVFDAPRNRVLASSSIPDGTSYLKGSLWELSLSPAPRWREIRVGRSSEPQVRLTFDATHNRLFGLSKEVSPCYTSAILLDNEADAEWGAIDGRTYPECEISAYDGLHRLVLDAARERLVGISDDAAWQLPLSGDRAGWAPLASAPVSVQYAQGAFDASRQRIVLVGGTESKVATFDLATDTWQTHDELAISNWFAGAALDPARDRILFFSGLSGTSVLGNATWQLGLEPLELEKLTPNTRGRELDYGAAVVWDSEREAVLTWGAATSELAATRQHGLQRGATWLELGAEGALGHTGQKAVYDTVGRAVVSFGGTGASFSSGSMALSDQVMRLEARRGADWKPVAVPAGPYGRDGHLAVYDSVRRRLVIHGGQGEPVATQGRPAEDTWALSLEGEPAWTQLSRGEGGPGPRTGQSGAYDPVGQRLIVFGGEEWLNPRTDLYALSLGEDESTWSVLAADGTAPALRQPSAFYDAAGSRIIFVQLNHAGTSVAALELGATPTWHTFCALGQVPVRVGSTAGVVLAPDGLFAAFGDATFRFDLQTPYCD